MNLRAILVLIETGAKTADAERHSLVGYRMCGLAFGYAKRPDYMDQNMMPPRDSTWNFMNGCSRNSDFRHLALRATCSFVLGCSH